MNFFVLLCVTYVKTLLFTVSNPLCCCLFVLFCFFFFLACAELSQFNHDTNPFVFLVENYFFRMSKQKSASGKKKQKFFSTEFLWFHFLFVCWPILKRNVIRSSSASESTSIILPCQEREDNVCPWETISSPPPSLNAGSGRTKGSLLTPGPSVDQPDGQAPIVSRPSAKKSSFSCSVESHPSTDLDVCPWESASAALPPTSTTVSSGGTRIKTSVPAPQPPHSNADDVVCPWESQDLETPKNPTAKSPSEVTVIVLNPSKQVSPVISLAGNSGGGGGSGHRRKESASGGVTVLPESGGSEQSSTSQQQPDNKSSSSKISDICPWEDEWVLHIFNSIFFNKYQSNYFDLVVAF